MERWEVGGEQQLIGTSGSENITVVIQYQGLIISLDQSVDLLYLDLLRPQYPSFQKYPYSSFTSLYPYLLKVKNKYIINIRIRMFISRYQKKW